MQEFICDFIIVAVLQSLHFCEVIFVSPLCEHMSCSAHFDTGTVFAVARPPMVTLAHAAEGFETKMCYFVAVWHSDTRLLSVI